MHFFKIYPDIYELFCEQTNKQNDPNTGNMGSPKIQLNLISSVTEKQNTQGEIGKKSTNFNCK